MCISLTHTHTPSPTYSNTNPSAMVRESTVRNSADVIKGPNRITLSSSKEHYPRRDNELIGWKIFKGKLRPSLRKRLPKAAGPTLVLSS